MEDYVTIHTPIDDYHVLQHIDGECRITLEGSYRVRSRDDYVVVCIYSERTNRLINRHTPTMEQGHWNVEVCLTKGDVYRIETGLVLAETGFDERYLGRGAMKRHVGVGEVFVVAGQSNASGYGQGEVDDGPIYGVCMLDRRDRWGIASHPMGEVSSRHENASLIKPSHSPWLALGKRIYRQANTPAGFIPLALNGSFLAEWEMGKPLYKALMNALEHAENLVFYQGCSDTVEGFGTYKERLGTFVRHIKTVKPNVRMVLVQLSGTKQKDASDRAWNTVREAQHHVANETNTPLIVTYDLTDYADDIHLGVNDNLTLARRVFMAFQGHTLATINRAERVNNQTVRMVLSNTEALRVPDGAGFKVEGTEGFLPVQRAWQDKQYLYLAHAPGTATSLALSVGKLLGRPVVWTTHQPLPAFKCTIQSME